jgi:predicted  nucleic acid-binding Zn-ribbon protein
LKELTESTSIAINQSNDNIQDISSKLNVLEKQDIEFEHKLLAYSDKINSALLPIEDKLDTYQSSAQQLQVKLYELI